MAIEKSSFVGNIERAIALSKWDEISKETADKPIKITSRDGATLFTVKMGVIIDTNFPTKAGNTTTALVLIPLDGGKEFPIDDGKIKMDGIAPFIYQGRGISRVFSMYAENGDILKKSKGGRKSAAAEIEELRKQIAAIAAMLEKK